MKVQLIEEEYENPIYLNEDDFDGYADVVRKKVEYEIEDEKLLKYYRDYKENENLTIEDMYNDDDDFDNFLIQYNDVLKSI